MQIREEIKSYIETDSLDSLKELLIKYADYQEKTINWDINENICYSAAGYLGASFVFEALSKKIKVVDATILSILMTDSLNFLSGIIRTCLTFEEADLTDAFYRKFQEI